MKINSVTMEWNYKYDNPPVPIVHVDRIVTLDEYRFTKNGNLYFAENDGFVEFFYYDKPGHGYGGKEFVINMLDGSQEILKGPWSSRGSVMNMMGFVPCMQCIYTTDTHRMYGYICMEVLNDYLNAHHELGLKVIIESEHASKYNSNEANHTFVVVDEKTGWKRV